MGNIYEPRITELLAHLNYALHARIYCTSIKIISLEAAAWNWWTNLPDAWRIKGRWPDGLHAASRQRNLVA